MTFISPGAHGDWHLVRFRPHKRACPHVRLITIQFPCASYYYPILICVISILADLLL